MFPELLCVFATLIAFGNAQGCVAPYANQSLPFGPNITRYAVTGLPDVSYSLPNSWAGLIGIPGTQDDALYFWLFAAEQQAQRNKLISKLPRVSCCAIELISARSLAQRWPWLHIFSWTDR